MGNPKYRPVECEGFEEALDEYGHGGNPSDTIGFPQGRQSRRQMLWMSLTRSIPWLLNFILLVILLLQNITHVSPWKGSFETGFQETELRSAFESIQFRSSEFQEPGDTAIETVRESPYIGKASPELDDTWNMLVAPTMLHLNDEEIGHYKDQTLKSESGWVTGLQVFHYLNCINSLRKAAYQHHYGAPTEEQLQRLDHCIDTLRLAVKCQSDLTPMLYFQPSNISDKMGLKSHTHTCRHFRVVHEWATARSTCKDDLACAVEVGKAAGGDM
ncbi:hypothetical protein PGQ11_012671 [Apiospora arundinis]|uniref:Cyclochlorotine biosynthesis protein O n=1 Tax=Apiospora arundinis TaxID=335852 RepID=A0ABR2I2Z2_9PEZI